MLRNFRTGSPDYTAPEVIQNVRGYDGKMADIWSAGVMLYTMLFARYPFERPEDKKLDQHQRLQRILHRIIKADYVIGDIKAITPACHDLLQKILVADPKQRLSIADIFQHPWVQHDMPPGPVEYNNCALALQAQPPQDEEEVKRVVHEVVMAGQQQGMTEEDVDLDDYLTQ